MDLHEKKLLRKIMKKVREENKHNEDHHFDLFEGPKGLMGYPSLTSVDGTQTFQVFRKTPKFCVVKGGKSC